MEGSDSGLGPAASSKSDNASEAEVSEAGAPEIAVLVIEDDPGYGCLIRAQLRTADPSLIVRVEGDFDQALSHLCSGAFEAATIDHMLGSQTGLQLIQLARERGVEIPLVLLTGSEDRTIERDAVAGGASDFVAKSEATGRLLARTVRLNVQRFAASAVLAEREQEARRQALHDPLTGLANRVMLDNEIASALLRLKTNAACGFTVMYMDLDGFKQINDQRGHAVGDAVLIEVARRLRAVVGGVDCVSRVGGDEFVVVLARCVNEAGAARIAEVIRAKVEAPLKSVGQALQVGVSIGVRVVNDTTDTPGDLLSAADAAMYSRKQQRRSRASLVALRSRKDSEACLETKLRRALESGLVVPHFQPIVTAATSEVAGFEALARWNDEELGAISPAQFIPVALRTGLIVELERQMLVSACRWVASVPGNSLVSVSVNVSAEHVRSYDFDSHVRDALRHSGLDSRRLQLELTEQVEWDKDEAIDAKLGALADDGVCLVLDDFGTGYSTAEVLARFPLTVVKLSRGLLVGAQASPRRMSMYLGLIELGKRLGASVTAEGIETAEDLALVKAAGATHIQGFLFGRPCALPELSRNAA